jgi:regulator of sirC expression with transglutaminase-like and TPR domain
MINWICQSCDSSQSLNEMQELVSAFEQQLREICNKKHDTEKLKDLELFLQKVKLIKTKLRTAWV